VRRIVTSFISVVVYSRIWRGIFFKHCKTLRRKSGGESIMDVKEPVKVNCIVCSKELDCDCDSMECPMGGTGFTATGNWGSTLFDPVGEKIARSSISTTLHTVICDECLREKAHFVRQKKQEKEFVTKEIKSFRLVLKEHEAIRSIREEEERKQMERNEEATDPEEGAH
jgi:hypothetical protein